LDFTFALAYLRYLCQRRRKLLLVVYGAAFAVKAYAVQLAKRSDIHPLICIADICKVLSTEGGKITNVPGFEVTVPDGVERSWTSVGSVHKEASNFGFAWFRMFGRGLQEGWFEAHPQEVVPGGLEGIQQALTNLKEGKASAVRYVFRIADTHGVPKLSL
jgi:hypothetical protein